MKKNRRVPKKMSVIATHSMRIGAIVLSVFVMVILNILAGSSCNQLMTEKGEKERQLRKLEAALMRESSRWDDLKTPEKVEVALIRHGLSMKLPRADQNVYMNIDGTPRRGQLSVARAKQRAKDTDLAQARTTRGTRKTR